MRSLSSTLALSLAALAFLSPVNSEADWQVNSQFLLQLPESIFDSLIQDFWQSLQGTKTVPVGNFGVNLGSTQLTINNVNVAVNYSFPVPTRLSGATSREWQLQSNAISATVNVGQLLISTQQTIYEGGIAIGTTVNFECDNVSLSLPAGQASVSAEISAGIANNAVHLTMPSFNATWPSNAWQVNAISCPSWGQVGQAVQAQILTYLANPQSLNGYIQGALESEFAKWSSAASVLLISQQNLPTGVSYLTASFQPSTATDENPNGLVIGGTLSFDYPNVQQGTHYEQDFDLPGGTTITPQANPQLLIPFGAIQAMLVGEYFAGQLTYTMQSSAISGFSSLMNNFFIKLFVWPDLLRFNDDANFLFQATPVGPPSFTNAAAGGTNVITGNLSQPLAVHMFAPIDNQYVPYVQFNTQLTGPTTMTLGANGQVKLQVQATQEPLTYAYASSFVNTYYPDTWIDTGAIASSAFQALDSDGVSLKIPPLAVGSSLTLTPSEWALQGGNVLQLEFTPGSTASAAAAAPAAAAKVVKTSNGQTLSVH